WQSIIKFFIMFPLYTVATKRISIFVPGNGLQREAAAWGLTLCGSLFCGIVGIYAAVCRERF
ncbi:MAG: hypothetical protein ACLS9D_13735, partial [Gemmiger formicilis]|uniref:hypothetical protein n=1 Tax=Gemmiger formicilis TaxID=745368 RepID=UPI0039954A5E